ncbi:MAG: hypothetical protein LBV79_02195, partial [Candidatus Adiutrix sp.]|jgi:all-trans-retinol 13,14-reductase|nr:hypothetical protein [Candidatus Adiutrix sp.]
VKALTGREARAIRTDGHNAAVAVECVESDGQRETIDFDLCVYTGSPAALPRLLPEGALRSVLSRRLSGLKYTPSPLMFFARSRSNWLEHRNLFLCPEDLENWFDPARRALYISGGPGKNGWRPLSVVALTAADAGQFGGRTPAYQAWKEREAEAARATLSAHCPELGDIEILAAASGLTLGDYSLNFGPGIYGKLHSAREAPVLPVTRVGRLALAGQSIVLPGLLGTLVSSALAVGSLCGHQEILEVLR